MAYTLLPDHYKALGVESDADAATIRASYRKLAWDFYFDKSTDPTDRVAELQQFLAVQRAFARLGDESERTRYDADRKLHQSRGRVKAKLPPSWSGRQSKKAGLDKGRDENRVGWVVPNEDDRSSDDEAELTERFESKAMEATGHIVERYIQACRRARQGRSKSQYPFEIISQTQPRGLKGVPGYIGGYKVTALADTGALQNCIRSQVVKENKLKLRKLKFGEPTVLLMGHGRYVPVLGAVDCKWRFAADGEVMDITLCVLADLVFDVILGNDFLDSTETKYTKSYRLVALKRTGNAHGMRLVNLCGTPVQCLRGTLGPTECSALPDSGAEPNLISYNYAEAQGWLDDMYEPPESCRLLQFANGSTETVSGRLKLQWSFMTGWGPAVADSGSHYEFDILRGCPFDVILGCYFLDDTEAFINHAASMHEIIKDGATGINVVVWVKSKFSKRAKANTAVSSGEQDLQRQIWEREVELRRRAEAEWLSQSKQSNGTHNGATQPSDPGPDNQLHSSTARALERSVLRRTIHVGDTGSSQSSMTSASTEACNHFRPST